MPRIPRSLASKRITNNLRIANSLYPGCKVTDIMKMAQVEYQDVQYAQNDDVIVASEGTPSTFSLTEAGKALIDDDSH